MFLHHSYEKAITLKEINVFTINYWSLGLDVKYSK